MPRGSAVTTTIYAPLELEYCVKAIAVIEEIVSEIQSKMTSGRNLTDPEIVFRQLLEARPRQQKLDDFERAILLKELQNGLSTRDVVRKYGITNTSVQKYRRLALRAVNVPRRS